MESLYYKEFESVLNYSYKFIDYKKFDNKTFLVTGATGLIGRYCVDFLFYIMENLDINIKIIVVARKLEKIQNCFKNRINNKNFIYYIQDICEELDVKEKIDYIIHTASPANPYFYANYPVEVITSNIIGTLNVLKLCENNNCKMIYTSSGEIYGSQTHDGNGFTENQPGIVDSSIVRSCYTESKRCSETLVSSYVQEHKVNASVARLSFVYGPTYSETETRVIFQFIDNYFKGEDIIMKSKGEQIRSYTYVSDCVTALLFILLNCNAGETYNVSNPNSIISIADIANKIINFSNNKISLVYQIPDQNSNTGFSPYKNAIQNSNKLIREGWKPQYEFDEGLYYTIEDKKLMMGEN